MSKLPRLHKNALAKFLTIAFVLSGVFFALNMYQLHNVRASGVYTVCPSECDYDSFGAAASDPITADSIIQLTETYIFDPMVEPTVFSLADNTTLECANGSDTFGDAAEAMIQLWIGSNTTIQHCTFENITFDASWKVNVSYSHNTFLPSSPSQLIFTGVDGFSVTNNGGLQKVQIQTAFNGTISNNSFECRWNNNCLSVTPAGGSPEDYFDPSLVPSNIDIHDNDFINYNTNTWGDWVIFNAGVDIDFTENLLQSYVTTQNTYQVMLTAEKGEFYIANNSFIFPSKDSPANSGTWGLNLRTQDVDLYVVAEHNMFLMHGGSASCTGIFQSSDATTPATVHFEFSYNLCADITNATDSTGFNFQYDSAFTTVLLTNEYNGLSEIEYPIQDTTGLWTSLDATTVTGNALFKTENASPDDDWHLAPMSRFLDVNGTIDIGVYSAARINEYTIDDNCVVDYVTCHSQFSSTITHALSSNDTVHIKDGNYAPLTIDRAVTNVTIIGESANVIFDAAGVSDGISIKDVSHSSFSNLTIKNASEAAIYSYKMTNMLFEYNSNTYDQTEFLGMPANSTVFIAAPGCMVLPVFEDDTDITSVIGSATDNWNLALVDVYGLKLTVVAPNNVISSDSELVDYLTTQCGVPALNVDYFLPDLFTVSNHIFTYNSATVAGAGISVKPGIANPPRIDTEASTSTFAGMTLINASNNSFDSITLENNDRGIVLDENSVDNEFIESVLTSNANAVISNANGVTKLINSTFGIASLVQDGTGSIEIYHSFRAKVQNSSDLSAINGVTVTIKDALGSAICAPVSGVDGHTSFCPTILVTTIASGGPYVATAGGINPIEFSVNTSGYEPSLVESSIQTPFATVLLSLEQIEEPEPPEDSGSDNNNTQPEQNAPSQPENDSTNTEINISETSEVSDLLAQKFGWERLAEVVNVDSYTDISEVETKQAISMETLMAGGFGGSVALGRFTFGTIAKRKKKDTK
ncbi:MAG: hypothetical protein QY314_02795 [Candidatus Dojkabacteria bacterium]|nr:MAG: hypothetical protein QY314_02795 [Candidatus Dojkabacteria bacterium]